MKTPRNLSGQDLVKILSKYGYRISRQKGSHLRLTRESASGTHHISIPDHNPLRLGTLSAILADVAEHLRISKEELLK